MRTLCACCENTVCAPWSRWSNCLDAVKTLWERRVDAVGTLWGCCVHAITGKFDILGVFCGDPTARWHGFRTLYKRCGIAVWCDRGLRYMEIHWQPRKNVKQRMYCKKYNQFRIPKFHHNYIALWVLYTDFDKDSHITVLNTSHQRSSVHRY